MILHDEAFELLALAALDALGPDEAVLVDEHVATCARCQGELDSMREVATALGTNVESLPDGLWTTIAGRLDDRIDPDRPPSPVAAIAAARRTARVPRRTRGVFAAVALGAAACIIALAIGLANANDHVARLQQALSSASASVVQTALATPGHRVVQLESAAHVTVAEFVILPNGHGYLVSATMPPLAPGQTYQLWGIVGGSPVSIGVMGRSPSSVSFTLASVPRPTALAVTVQRSGGSLKPSKTIAASGAV